MAAEPCGGAIADWLGSELSLAGFLREHYQRRPYVRPSTAAAAAALLDWNVVAALVDAGADMLLVRNGRLRREPAPTGSPEARSLFDDGYSLVLRACEEPDRGLRDLAERVASEIDGDVSIQVYATPAGFHSFGWHYDCEDVFIVQAHGVKDYVLRQNTVNPEPTIDAMPKDMHYERETTPRIACTLITGDWLYIPRGWWHAAFARSHSLSISVGVLSPPARGARPPGTRGVRRR
jgi:ribosomal protein L16 Arg81 hydroxylase